VKYGFVFPRGSARLAADFAREAEQAGWDGFFVWEPIWVVAAWGNARSMARALRYDGILPTRIDAARKHVPVTPEDVRGIAEYAAARRETGSPALDIIVEGVDEGNAPSLIADTVRPMAEAGATWWIEAMWSAIDDMATPEGQAAVLARLRLGPPRS
jgi:hypothetical protein